MQKGKFGFYLWFYAVLAFLLAFLQQILLCGLLLGFVILVEKDDWLTKQTMQAFFLTLASSIVNGVIKILTVLNDLPFMLGSIFKWLFSILESGVSLLVFILAIIAVIRVCKGEDAALPMISKIIDKAFGIVKQRASTVPPQQYYTPNPFQTSYGSAPGQYNNPQKPPVPPQYTQAQPPPVYPNTNGGQYPPTYPTQQENPSQANQQEQNPYSSQNQPPQV